MNKLLKKLKEMEQTSKGMIDAQVEGMEFYRKTVNQLLTLNEENLDRRRWSMGAQVGPVSN